MQIKDNAVFTLIEEIGEHYRSNVANRFLRPIFSRLVIERKDLENLEALMEKNSYYRYQGYFLDDLYGKILSVARFIFQARKVLLPGVKGYIQANSRNMSANDRILADMAGANFPTNLKILTDKLNELYVLTAQADTQISGTKTPLHQKLPEIQEIGNLLIEK